MSESDGREAFHAAIWQSPDDDLPRLVYADWLDERNEHDAAAFLRLLCAVRTCPPDVDRLRPLVADFRRAMAKVPLTWIEDVCPIPPAVVVGAWVDLDHEANREVLDFIRHRRKEWQWIQTVGDGLFLRPAHYVPNELPYIELIWSGLLPLLSPVASCVIDKVPVMIDVWSGVIMAVAEEYEWCRVRNPAANFDEWDILTGQYDPDSTYPFDLTEERVRAALAEFDPANRPG